MDYSISQVLVGIFVFGFVITLIVVNGIARANEYYKRADFAKQKEKRALESTNPSKAHREIASPHKNAKPGYEQ